MGEDDMSDDIVSALYLMFGMISGIALVLLGIDKFIYRVMLDVKTYFFDIWR
jgi:hypothetical protein